MSNVTHLAGCLVQPPFVLFHLCRRAPHPGTGRHEMEGPPDERMCEVRRTQSDPAMKPRAASVSADRRSWHERGEGNCGASHIAGSRPTILQLSLPSELEHFHQVTDCRAVVWNVRVVRVRFGIGQVVASGVGDRRQLLVRLHELVEGHVVVVGMDHVAALRVRGDDD